MRLSLAGSTGWFGSTYSSRLPLPLVSRMNGVQPCDFASSPVSSNIFALSQPTTPLCGPPALVHSVLLASSRELQMVGREAGVDQRELLPVFGSYIET